MIPRWSEDIVTLLSIGTLEITQSKPIDKAIIEQSGPFQLLSGRLYHQGLDGVLRLCIEPSETALYLCEAHKNIGCAHHGKQRTYQNLMRLGVYCQI